MRRRLLLVDDDPRDLAHLEEQLAPLAHGILRATDGRTALVLFSEHRPDLVLLNLVMPDSDGLDVLARMRAHEIGDRVPIILVAARGTIQDRLRGLEGGADEYLEKPFDVPLLLSRVRTLLGLKSSRDAMRRSKEELEHRNAALERLHREQRELMAFVVHDLKNPLGVVGANVELARELVGAPGSLLAEALDEASGASRRLRAMIEDLSTVSLLEESQFTLHAERVPISDLLQEAVQEYTRRAHEKKVELLTPQAPAGHVTADRALLLRVIENILDNSLRYTPAHGRVGLAARVGTDVLIAVSNSGPAIPAAERLRVFEKFARLENDGSARGNTGLGLYFCKRAVEAQGGSIEVTETPEWPTSFVVRLPAS
ncbi:MAG: response regulator [Myxococcota bacterium]|nr:response regulator [Myxococcota bacterium]